MRIIRFGGQFAKLCFIAVFSFLFALGPGSTVRASSIGFQVSGRFLLDANGNNFVMRGINVPHNWYPEQTSSSLQNIKAKGANTVRIVLSNGQSGLWPKDSASDVANVINLCKANKLICVLEVHDTTAHMTTLAQAVAYWIEIKSALMGQEAYVIINIGNEPYGNPPPEGPDTTLWIGDTKDAIAELRAAGFQHTLMVDGPDWGQDWEWIMSSNAASIFNSDPLRNTVFSIHMYEVFDTANQVQNYVSSFVNAGLPLVIGEFGPVNGGPGADVDAVMATAQANGIGYLGWEWSGDGDPQLDMVVNFDPNQLTWWGNRIINGPNGIASTSQEASIYTLDGRTDVSVFRPSNGVWYVKDQFSVQYGANGDIPVPGDYNGDGLSDVAVFRRSNGVWYVRNQFGVQFGANGDIPVPGDYNGDGIMDVAVFRPSNGVWYVRNQFGVQFGANGDIPIPGDYNGDGITDVAVFRPSNGVWYVRNQFGVQFGANGDIPVPGDYDGDGDADVAVFRPSNGVWYVRNQFGVQFGANGDIPVPGDYNGDGNSDVAVFRPSNGVWYVKDQFGVQFGANGDFPLPAHDTNGDGDPYQ